MSPSSGLPRYNAIPGAGELVGPPPFNFSGVVLRVFPFQANGQKLQRFVSQCLNNIVPDEIVHYRLALPYVYALMVSYEEMSLAVAHGNWISQYEVTLSVPLERYRRIRGRLVFQDWTWFSPYILVSEELSHMTGREVYGWPKELAELGQRESYWERHPRNPRNLMRLSTRAVAFSEGRPSFRYQPLIDIDQLAPTSFLQLRPRENEMLQVPVQMSRSAAGALARSMDLGAFMAETWGAGAIGMELEGAIPPSFPPAALFREMLRRPTNSTTTLKQFRDEVHPKCACYQAIVSAPLELRSLRNVGLLGEANVLWGDSSGGYRVRLFDDVTHPIGHKLGLISGEDPAPRRDPGGRRYADLVPVMPFWVEADLNYGEGTVLAWRDHRNEWRYKRGDATWVLKRHDQAEHERPSFNESLGGAPERLMSRLNPHPKDNDLEEFRPRRDPEEPTEDQRETPDLRLQRATYLVFGFEANLEAQRKTCSEYLDYVFERDNVEWKFEPVPTPMEPGEAASDTRSTESTESYNGRRTGSVFLLFGVIEQYGGQPTLGGESWRIFDVQIGFPVKRRRRDGSGELEGQVYFVAPYQFTDQALAGIVSREFYGWPVVPANIGVSDTAWFDPEVSGYSVRYKAQRKENAFFHVAVDGPEGKPIKVVEMLLQPPSKDRSDAGKRTVETAARFSPGLDELIALVKNARRGGSVEGEGGRVEGEDWNPKRFSGRLTTLISRYMKELEKRGAQAYALEGITEKDLDGVLKELDKRRQRIDALVREAYPEGRDKQEIVDALERLENELWEIHPAANYAGWFMNQAKAEPIQGTSPGAESDGDVRRKPVSIQRIGLKQFRAADAPREACYQAVVQTPIELDDWSESRSGFRRRPHFAWFSAGSASRAVVRFHRGEWARNLALRLGLKSDASDEEEDFGYSEPKQLFKPFFMSGQLKIYRSYRLQWRTGKGMAANNGASR